MADKPVVAIIGAGIIGASCAYWLQQVGFHVLMIDRAQPGHATSYGNACTLAPYACLPIAQPGLWKQLPRMLCSRESGLAIRYRYLPQLMPWLWQFIRASKPTRAKAIARVLANTLQHVNTGIDPIITASHSQDLFSRKGCLHLYDSQRTRQRFSANVAWQRSLGVEIEHWSADTVRAAEPHLAPIYHSADYLPTGFQVTDPLQYTDNIMKTVISHGGKFRQTEVKGIVAGDHKVTLLTVDGDSLIADQCLIAAGAWSKPFCLQLGDDVPLESERGYHVMFDNQDNYLTHPTCWMPTGFYLAPMSEQRLRAAGTVELASFDAPPWQARLDLITRQSQQMLPQLGAATSTWLGFRPSMPDSMPVLSRASHFKRVFYAFGHGHAGLTLSGITAKLMAEMMTDQVTTVDCQPFSVQRFAQ